MVFGLWRRQLSQTCKNAVAGKVFNKETYKEVLEYADEIHYANRSDNPSRPTIAAVEAPAQNAPQAQATPAVAAVAAPPRNQGGGRNRGRNRTGNSANGGNNGNSNRQASGNSGNSGNSGPTPDNNNRGPRHPDQPPPQSCQTHWTFGRGAWWCQNPARCPWKNNITQRPARN